MCRATLVPASQVFGSWEFVKGGVELQRIEVFGIKFKPSPLTEIQGVKYSPPLCKMITRATDPHVMHIIRIYSKIRSVRNGMEYFSSIHNTKKTEKGMAGRKKEKIIPHQREGAQKDIEHAVTALDENDARKLFMIARNRLLDVNHWKDFAKTPSSTFQLTDRDGNEVERTAQVGDFFKIDIPAPGPQESRGYDWVNIEAIEETSAPNDHTEVTAMRVRPAHDPKAAGENITHFFKDASTSSFVVRREGNVVMAAVYGRNERPNLQTTNLIDKIRNTLVGLSAMAGLSDIQWRNLVEGFLSPAE